MDQICLMFELRIPFVVCNNIFSTDKVMHWEPNGVLVYHIQRERYRVYSQGVICENMIDFGTQSLDNCSVSLSLIERYLYCQSVL